MSRLDQPLPDPGQRPDLLIIAGEHSGDEHAAAAVRSLRKRRPDLRIAAFAGPSTAEAGAHLIIDMTEAAVVGLVEVLKHFSFLKALYGRCVEWVAAHRPRAVCFVDYPGFNLRLARAFYERGLARQAGGEIKLLYYISPQIWAWKGQRRFAMARMLDGLAVIFPFEVKSHADTVLPVEFVGHPFLALDHQSALSFRVDGDILLLPGSRRIAVNRIFPVLAGAFARFRRQHPEQNAVVVYPDETIFQILRSQLERWPELKGAVSLVPRQSPVAARAVLTSSGTMSLSCALAGVPGAIAYRANWLTYAVGKAILKVPYLGIGNILLNRSMYPEYIQEAAHPEALRVELEDSAFSSARRERAGADAAELRRILSAPASRTVDAWLEEQLG